MKIRKCPVCRKYTLQEKCAKCSSETVYPKPAKFSPVDPYGAYRRRMKKELLEDAHQKNSS